MAYDLVFLDGWKKASATAKILGLVEDYFSQAVRLNSLPQEWESISIDGTLYVKPPEDIRILIKNGYTAVKIVKYDDTKQYEKIIKVGKMTTIGFWR